MELLIVVVVTAVVGGGVGSWIAAQKRRNEVEGAVLGALFGPIGWIIEAVLPTKERAPTRTANHYAPTVRSQYGDSRPSRAVIPDYLQVPFWSHPDSQRPRGGKDGRPGTWLSFTEPTAQEAVDALVKAELVENARKGSRVVEAVWSTSDQPRIQAAFGDPERQYELLFPDKPRVVWESKVGVEAAPATTPPTAVPGVVPADAAVAGPGRSAPVVVDEPAMPEPTAPAEPGGNARPTKNCPDCAETILADARICRFCRYEFWDNEETLDSNSQPASRSSSEGRRRRM